MSTPLSNLGFSAQPAPGELENLARKCSENGRARRCQSGMYIVWTPGAGIELWAQVRNEELIGLSPHFAGKTRASAGLIQRVARAGFPMDGGFRALAQPFGADPIRGAFPFVFDAPDFLLHAELELPAIRTIQLAAFPQQCSIFDNENDFKTRTARHGLNFAADAVIPLGIRSGEGEPHAEPLATAMVCGHVLEAEALVNPVTKLTFTWIKLRTALGELDVASDPAHLHRTPRAGNILQCSAWLSGVIHEA